MENINIDFSRWFLQVFDGSNTKRTFLNFRMDNIRQFKFWILILILSVTCQAKAIDTSCDLYIATDNTPDICHWKIAGYETNGLFQWLCGIPLGNPNRLHLPARVDLKPEKKYLSTVWCDSGLVCDAMVMFGRPDCYDIYINDKKNDTYPNWRNGYYLGEGPNSSSFVFEFYIKFNSNCIPAATWSAKDATGWPSCIRPQKGHYGMINDGTSEALAGIANDTYMGTNYPATFELQDTNINPTGAYLINFTNKYVTNTFVYTTNSILVTNITVITNRITLTNGVVLVAGTNLGTVEVIAITANPNPCLATNFYFDFGTCGGCLLGENCNKPQPSLHSVDVKFNLGPSSEGGNNAFLQIKNDQHDLSLATPKSLQCNYLRPEILLITNLDGSLRQVKALDRIIDVVSNTPMSYLIKFYRPENLGSEFTNGLFTFQGNPFQVNFVEFYNGDTNHLRISDDSDPAPIEYYWTTNGWSLTTGGGIRNESLIVTTNGALTTKNRIIKNAQGGIERQDTEVWQAFQFGSRLTQKSIGSNSDQSETNTYTADGMLQQSTRGDGSWDIYVYDAMRRQVGHYSPFLNSAPTTNATLCRYVASSYDVSVVAASGDDGKLELCTPRQVTEYVLGNEVSRRYTVLTTGMRQEIQCSTPGAAWNAAGNLNTVSYIYTDVVNLGLPSKIVNPDGTIQIFAYDNGPNLPIPGIQGTFDRTTVWAGAPDYTLNVVADGRMEESWKDSNQRMVLRRVTDVATQIITDQERYFYDESGHLTNTAHLNRTFTRQVYDCCGLTATVSPDGIVTSYGYDALKRRVMTVQNGVTTSNVFNADGNVTATLRYGSDGSVITNNSTVYSDSGQISSSSDALGNKTAYTNYFDGSGQLVRVTTNPDLSTVIDTFAKDGQMVKHSGTAVSSAMRYAYGVESESGVQRFYKQEIKLDANGNDTSEWTKTYTDMLGRDYKTVYASAAGTPASQSFYNTYGQLVKQVDPDGVTTLYQYNAKGQPAWTAVDLNTNGVIDFGGNDRISYTVSDVVSNGYNLYVNRSCSYVWNTANVNSSNLVSMSINSVDGLKSWNIIYNNGTSLTNYSQTVYDPANGYVTVTSIAPDKSYSVSTSQYGRQISVVRYDGNGGQLGRTDYGYDAQGRPNTVTDARNGTMTSLFNAADQVTSMVSPPADGIQSPQVTANYFDSLGRVIRTVLPDNTSVTNVYYTNSLLQKAFGSRTYPVAYTYDYAGRMKTMTTWTNSASSLGAAVTTWNYDGYRGFLTNKAYADGKGPAYTYTAAGRLGARTWARGITTTYAFDNAGGLKMVGYSDSTPGMTNGYDRLGRTVAVTNGATVCAWAYNDLGEVLSESYTGGPLNGISVTNGYDSLLRRSKLSLLNPSSLASSSYGYDAASRLATVSDGTNSASYNYLANSPLVGQIAFKNGGTTRMTTTKQYDYLNRLAAIQSSTGVSPVSSFNYSYNQANQRTQATNVDNSYWAYQYDSLGQVISGKKYWADGTPVAGQQFTYNFDDIGNRKSTAAGGDASGNNLRPANYTANSLNQYTSRDVPGYTTVLGSANPNATATVNLQRATRQGSYFSDELAVNNASSAQWLTLTNLAVLNNGTNADIVATNMGNVFIAQTPEAFSYDLDGNLINDGRFSYVWDAENRLLTMTSQSSAPTASKVKLDFAYDYQSRRVQKIVSTNNGTSYVAVFTNKFVYDGWNLMAVLNFNFSLLNSFVWGMDLSGSLQGAGGVGGLLAETYYGTGTTNCFVAYDGNGNVATLVNANDGSTAASYEYDPFGQLIRSTGPLAKVNPIRFSTKYQDDETSLNYYGYRFYNPNPGRWLSRDLIGENGGVGLYEFVGNNPLNGHDFLGLKIKGCIDKYLDTLGLKADIDYNKSKDGIYSAMKDIQGTGAENFSKLVVIRMMKSTAVFSLAGSDEDENESNLKKHIGARQTIVNNALHANFVFGTGSHFPVQGLLSDPQKFFDDLNNRETAIACQALSLIIFTTGNKSSHTGFHDYDKIWIPGDWGYIRNLDFEDHPEHWGRDELSPGAWAGENVFHTGISGEGEMFWGHFDAHMHSAKSEKDWWVDVKNWGDKDGKLGRGIAKWRDKIKHTTVGLVQ